MRAMGRPLINRLYWLLVVLVTYVAGFGPVLLFLIELARERGYWHAAAFAAASFCLGRLIAWRLPEAYYGVHRPDQAVRFYELLGVRQFRFFVPNGDAVNRLVRRFHSSTHRVIRDLQSMIAFERITRLAERCHVMWALAILPSVLCALLLGWNGLAAAMTLPNLVLHVYPVLLQRYTRLRIVRVQQRFARELLEAPAACEGRDVGGAHLG